MEPENTQQETVIRNQFHEVTPLSKFLALALFIILPFLGGWIGYTYAPEKVVEIEKVVEVEKAVVQQMLEKDEERLLLATTTVDMGEYKIRYSNDKIELINDALEVLQTIPWDTSFSNVYSYESYFLITNRDINYDHYLDLGVLNSVGYGGVNLFYEFYVYDSVNQRLVLEENLRIDGEVVLSNPTFNIEKRYIYSNMKSGQDLIRKQYIFDGEKYVNEDAWVKKNGIQKDVGILDKKELPTTVVDMGEYKIRYSNDKIELMNDLSQVLQTIPWDTSYRKYYRNDDALLITNRDINYDHYLDLGFVYSVIGGGPSAVYNFYVYNPTTQQLDIVKELGVNEGGVANPGFDVKEKSITSNAKAAQEWFHTKYVFDGEKYMKGESWSEGWE